jgi:DNA polymerase II small subunit
MNNTNNIVKSCLQNGFLIEPELLNLLSEVPFFEGEVNDYLINLFCSISEGKILSIENVSGNIEKVLIILNNYKEQKKEKEAIIEGYHNFLKSRFKKSVKIQETEEAGRKEIQAIGELKGIEKEKIQILNSFVLPSREIGVTDFVNHFRNRFVLFKNILQEHAELQNLTSINKINSQRQNISIIGMVFGKRITKNKNMLFEVEDLTGRALLLVNSNKEEVFKKAEETVLDDILGFRCSGNSEILFVNDIIFPDATLPNIKKSNEEEYAAFTSDLHVGSTRFLEENFLKFAKWLNCEIGSSKQKEMAGKVKYLFIIGDCVDGIGVYPGQEDLLLIKDIRLQYEKLAELLSKIRKDVTIILCPGQHDSVRIAEPQPAIDRFFAEPLYNLDNLILVSNPALVNIGASREFQGIKVLMYHGASFHSLIDDIEELRILNAHHSPSRVVKHILRRRHLAPTHSSVVYIPTDTADPLAITTIPDVIATGELHRTDISSYNNILTVSCSCWQSITPYEEKIGNEPDPCKVPILNLKTGQVNIIDFSS